MATYHEFFETWLADASGSLVEILSGEMHLEPKYLFCELRDLIVDICNEFGTYVSDSDDPSGQEFRTNVEKWTNDLLMFYNENGPVKEDHIEQYIDEELTEWFSQTHYFDCHSESEIYHGDEEESEDSYDDNDNDEDNEDELEF